jgi:FAD/FMN-containing dehydrogenase
MQRPLQQTLSGWGNFPRQPAGVYRAHRWRDAMEVVANAPARGVAIRGLGRSYGDAALNAHGAILLTERLDRLLGFDPESGVVECESGVTFATLLEVFVPRGWFLPVTPGTRHVTVGGAIAADVHGKNHHRDGSLGTFVLDLRLLTGTGDVIECSREANVDAFWATIGGMGLTGVILSARLRLRPIRTSYMRVDTFRVAHLDEALERFEKNDPCYDYSVAWIDCMARGRALGRSVLLHARHAGAHDLGRSQAAQPLVAQPRRARNVPRFTPGGLLNARTVQLFNALYYARHPTREGSVCHFDAYFYPLDALGYWNRIYGPHGFIQYQVAFDAARSREGLIALLDAVSRSGRGSFLAVLKAFGRDSPGLLSFPRSGYTLALDIPHRGADFAQFVAQLDRITLAHGGRVYLAKDACLDAESFKAMYPAAGRFREVKRRLDPMERLSSSLARRVGLTENRCRAAS